MSIHGLRNIGNTCFLNTAIQCLVAISRFRILLTILNIPEMGFFQQIIESTSSTILTPFEIYDLYLKLSCTERHKQGDTVECFLQFLQHFDENCTQINCTHDLIFL
jgi:ubiquitin C-terminal hydrolase